MEPINRQHGGCNESGNNNSSNKYEMVTSVAAFHGIESNDEISFEKGELITIHRRDAHRCFGERLNGKQRGWFSATAVKPIGGKVGSIASTFDSVVTTTRIFVDQNQKLKNSNIKAKEEEKKVETKEDKDEVAEEVRAELNDKKAVTMKFESTTKMTQSSYHHQLQPAANVKTLAKEYFNFDHTGKRIFIGGDAKSLPLCDGHKSQTGKCSEIFDASKRELLEKMLETMLQKQQSQQQFPSEQPQVGRIKLRQQPSRPPIDSIESTSESVTTYSSSSLDRNSASSYDTVLSTSSTDESTTVAGHEIEETNGISSANFVVAILRFDATDSNHLSLAVGDIVLISSHDLQSEWYEGERIMLRNSPNYSNKDGSNELSPSRSETNSIGWFPAANVKTLAKEYFNFDHTGKRIFIGGDAKSLPLCDGHKSQTGKCSEIFDASKRELLEKMLETMLQKQQSQQQFPSEQPQVGRIKLRQQPSRPPIDSIESTSESVTTYSSSSLDRNSASSYDTVLSTSSTDESTTVAGHEIEETNGISSANFVVAILRFDATDSNHLSLAVGDIVRINSHDLQSEWYEGERIMLLNSPNYSNKDGSNELSPSRSETNSIGWFPAANVKTLAKEYFNFDHTGKRIFIGGDAKSLPLCDGHKSQTGKCSEIFDASKRELLEKMLETMLQKQQSQQQFPSEQPQVGRIKLRQQPSRPPIDSIESTSESVTTYSSSSLDRNSASSYDTVLSTSSTDESTTVAGHEIEETNGISSANFVVAILRFDATDSNHLSLAVGDIVRINSHDLQSEWYEGERIMLLNSPNYSNKDGSNELSPSRSETNSIGWFPAANVKTLAKEYFNFDHTGKRIFIGGDAKSLPLCDGHKSQTGKCSEIFDASKRELLEKMLETMLQKQQSQQQFPSEQPQVGRIKLRQQPSRPPIDSIESTSESVTTYSSSSLDRNSASSYDTVLSTSSTDESTTVAGHEIEETNGISSANFVVAILRFDATDSNHLSLAVGDIVRINSHDLQSEWYEGERIMLLNSPNYSNKDGSNELSPSRSETNSIGWFPAANVKTLAKEYFNFDHTGKRIFIGGDAKSLPLCDGHKSQTGKCSEIFDASKRELLEKMLETMLQKQQSQQQFPSEQPQVGRIKLRQQPSRPPIDSIESTSESVTTYSSSSLDRNSASSYDTVLSTSSTDESTTVAGHEIEETNGISSANFVVAILRFDATDSNHLSLAVGDIVLISSHDLQSEWYEGERIMLRNSPNYSNKDGSNELSPSCSETNSFGWFPAANVKTLTKEYLNFDHMGKRIGIGGDTKSLPLHDGRKSQTGKWSQIFDTSKSKLLKKMSKTMLPQQHMLRQHSSHKQAENDRVYYSLIEDLWLAKISSQIPSPKTSLSPPTSPKPIDPIAQRAKIIDEMLSSEQKFLKDLTFVIEKFSEWISESPSFAPIEVDFSLFFDHLRLIKDMHARFCENLQKRLEPDGDENRQTTTTEIGDLLCEHFATVSPVYQRFCGANIAKLLSAIDADTTLVSVLDKLIAKNNLAKLSCDAYLLLPLRHLISYPVKIENLLPNISPTERDYTRCVEARDAARRFCEATNHAYGKTCCEWERFQLLAWIQSHFTIPVESLDQTITFDSITQFVGPRELLHAGLLYKDSKLLLVLLFNDMLLFASPTDREHEREIERKAETARRSARTVPDVSQVLKLTEIWQHTFKIYHKPLRLDKFRIGKLLQLESSLYSHYVFHLKAEKRPKGGGDVGGIGKVTRPIALRAASLDDMAKWVEQITIAQNKHKQAKEVTLELECAATTPSVDLAGMPAVAIIFLSSIEAVQLCTTNHALLAYCKLAIGRRWTEAHTFTTTEIVRSDKPAETTSYGAWRTFSTITFGIERNLCVYDTSDILFVRCFEANRFAPPRFIGEATLPIEQLIAQSRHLKKFTKGTPLIFADEFLAKSLSELHKINPCLLIKFDLL